MSYFKITNRLIKRSVKARNSLFSKLCVDEEEIFDCLSDDEWTFKECFPFTGLIRFKEDSWRYELIFFKDGKRHRKNGPAHIIYHSRLDKYTSETYYHHGMIHRTNGPAWIYYDHNDRKIESSYYYKNKRFEVKNLKEFKSKIKVLAFE